MLFQSRDFIATADGLLFAVVTSELEDDRVLCCLRYLTKGPRAGKLSTEEANVCLQQSFPEYLFHSAKRDVQLHGVPVRDVVRHYSASQRVVELLESSDCADPIERKAVRLLKLFDSAGIPATAFGVTGSVLVGMQHPDSDIDLVLYDRDRFTQARTAIRQMNDAGTLQAIDLPTWRETYRRRGCSLTFDEYLWHERRKFNKGVIEGTKFDLALVTTEPTEEAETWRKQGFVRKTLHVTDDRFAFDYPAKLLVDSDSISEVVSFTPTYVGQAKTGEQIEVAGFLERSASGHQRIVIGTSREATGEYIKYSEPLETR